MKPIVTLGAKLGLWSGVGLVVADMVGTGVLTTAGYMAFELSPSQILLDWLVGGLVALAGALAYAAVARQVPRSGGEYRYLSTLVHPWAGYLAGWTSLLVGFSFPTAIAALGAGAFGETVFPGLSPKLTAVTFIALITGLHALNMRTSRYTQNVLVVVKAVILAAFVLIGLFKGTNALPAFTAPPGQTGFPVQPFFTSLIFISFCYSGWNAAAYASDEFDQPQRNVPRAMLIGCGLVMGLYLLVNWVFVTNLTQADMGSWITGDTKRITLAHLVVQNLLGAGAAKVMSVMVMVALMSAISAMMLIGPRVYAAMARDGFLPRVLAGRDGHPPVGSVVLQGGIAIGLIFISQFRELLNDVSSILAIVSAATVLSLFRVRFSRTTSRAPGPKPGVLALGCALAFSTMSGWMVYFAVKNSALVHLFGGRYLPKLVLWMIAIFVVATIGYVVTVMLSPRVGQTEAAAAGEREAA